MTPQEMMGELIRRKESSCFDEETINLCFQVMISHPNKIEKCRAATILSGIVEKGLGKRTQKFLGDNPFLPERVKEVLNSAILRMEGF